MAAGASAAAASRHAQVNSRIFFFFFSSFIDRALLRQRVLFLVRSPGFDVFIGFRQRASLVLNQVGINCRTYFVFDSLDRLFIHPISWVLPIMGDLVFVEKLSRGKISDSVGNIYLASFL